MERCSACPSSTCRLRLTLEGGRSEPPTGAALPCRLQPDAKSPVENIKVTSAHDLSVGKRGSCRAGPSGSAEAWLSRIRRGPADCQPRGGGEQTKVPVMG